MGQAVFLFLKGVTLLSKRPLGRVPRWLLKGDHLCLFLGNSRFGRLSGRVQLKRMSLLLNSEADSAFQGTPYIWEGSIWGYPGSPSPLGL